MRKLQHATKCFNRTVIAKPRRHRESVGFVLQPIATARPVFPASRPVLFSTVPSSSVTSPSVASPCRNERCELKEICPSSKRNLDGITEQKIESGQTVAEYNNSEGQYRGTPSVSSLFPSGPGSTDPSEWPLRSFYKRELPSNCIRFAGDEGVRMFQDALAAGTGSAYFPLAEQFRTQDEPAFCGLSTLTMVLNALSIDPGRIWKGGWRWFSEEMLDCCESLERIRKQGIAFDKLACLASCNGAAVETWRARGLDSDEEHLRQAVKEACSTSTHFLIACYSRSVLGQTGEGHFSPIAAYHEESDMVLIMDTARFKYPPHWVPLKLLVKAMQKEVEDSGKPRGYMRLSRASGDGSPSSSVLFVLTLRKGFDESALRRIRKFFASVRASKLEMSSHPNINERGENVGSGGIGIRIGESVCKTCSSDGLEISAYVSCFFSAVPSDLLSAVSTVVHEFRVDPADFGEISVRPKYQDTVCELLRDIRALPVFPHVVSAAEKQKERLKGILEAVHGLELLTVLLLAAPVGNLSACGTRVQNAMKQSEDGASEIVRNEIKALRNQLWTVFEKIDS
eukprot:CAMPEP_0114510510 /NCGR_PEP_ID=MMETSP0109-20121206/13837_1 /TAXON_ID=29199 /ORGANISM="Chlorarachnion reptans, Strain CCCM449" /LENGTH=567 /DNA_ID=CAMNT_0001689845 /DNA_START=80 /DNA_END=1783 /DNA_ORIENTATION=-